MCRFTCELILSFVLASFLILHGRQLQSIRSQGIPSNICLAWQGCKETCEKQPVSSLSPKSELVRNAQCTDPKCHVHSVEERVPPRGAQRHLCDPLHHPDLEKHPDGEWWIRQWNNRREGRGFGSGSPKFKTCLALFVFLLFKIFIRCYFLKCLMFPSVVVCVSFTWAAGSRSWLKLKLETVTIFGSIASCIWVHCLRVDCSLRYLYRFFF